MRIFKNRVYLCWEHPGISGFKKWDDKQYMLASGAKVRGSGAGTVVGEYSPSHDEQFTDQLGGFGKPKFFDGVEAVAYLEHNPYVVLYRVGE